MTAEYWFVQLYVVGGKPEPEQPCASCAEVVAKVMAFRASDRDPGLRLRVKVPSYATDAERREIIALSGGAF